MDNSNHAQLHINIIFNSKGGYDHGVQETSFNEGSKRAN